MQPRGHLPPAARIGENSTGATAAADASGPSPRTQVRPPLTSEVEVAPVTLMSRKSRDARRLYVTWRFSRLVQWVTGRRCPSSQGIQFVTMSVGNLAESSVWGCAPTVNFHRGLARAEHMESNCDWCLFRPPFLFSKELKAESFYSCACPIGKGNAVCRTQNPVTPAEPSSPLSLLLCFFFAFFIFSPNAAKLQCFPVPSLSLLLFCALLFLPRSTSPVAVLLRTFFLSRSFFPHCFSIVSSFAT